MADETVFDEIASAITGTATHREAVEALTRAGYHAHAIAPGRRAGSAITILVDHPDGWATHVAWIGGSTSKWHIHGPGEKRELGGTK